MSDTAAVTESPVTQVGDAAVEVPVVVNEVSDEPKVGEYVGQCKWFNDKLGYGFLTIQLGEKKGKDIFVHHSGIMPLNSNYKTLKKGEYVNFNIINGDNGLQGVDVTGIGGGSLMCDVTPTVKYTTPMNTVTTPATSPVSKPAAADFVKVQYKKKTSGPPSAYKPMGGAGRGNGHGGGRGGGRRPYQRPAQQQ